MARLATDSRREPRIATRGKASVRIALGIDLIDISANGARAKVSIPLPVGTLVKLGLGVGRDRHARVVWADGGLTGFEFLAPLAPAELPDALPAS